VKVVLTDGGRIEAGFKGKAPGDCVTRAIALATGLPYLQVYTELNAIAKDERPKPGWARSDARLGVYRYTYERFLKQLGWAWVPTMLIGSGCKVHLRAEELPPGRLVVVVSKHLTCVIDGVIHDQFDPARAGKRCVYGYYSTGER